MANELSFKSDKGENESDSDFLQWKGQDITSKEQLKEPTNSILTSVVSEIWEQSPSKETLTKKLEVNEIPNSSKILLVKVNPEIWKSMITLKPKQKDLRNMIICVFVKVHATEISKLANEILKNKKKFICKRIQTKLWVINQSCHCKFTNSQINHQRRFSVVSNLQSYS